MLTALAAQGNGEMGGGRKSRCSTTVRSPLSEPGWIQDIDGLIELSDPNIEIVGPRGSGHGHALLRAWLGRAGLSLETRRIFARGSTVVVAQHGVWRSVATGEVTGQGEVASIFRVDDQRVVQFARHDRLDDAIRQAGLDYSDEAPKN